MRINTDFEEELKEQTEKDRLGKSKISVDSTCMQMTNKMKSFIGTSTAIGFRTGIEAANIFLPKCGMNPKALGGHEQITSLEVATATITTAIAFTASVVISPFVAAGDQIKRYFYKLSKEQVLWMLLYGVPLIRNCDENQIDEIANNLITQKNSEKAISILQNIDYDFKERKENCISYISNVNNNGHRTYAVLFKTLQSLDIKTYLDATIKSDPANLTLEYLFEDFKMYKS